MFLVNLKNHVVLNLEHRHFLFCASVVNYWFDQQPYDGADKTKDKRRSIRIVQCASLVLTKGSLAEVEEIINQKLQQFLTYDNSIAVVKNQKRKRTVEEVEEKEEEKEDLEKSIRWLLDNKKHFIEQALTIRKELGIEKHSCQKKSIKSNFSEYYPFLFIVQKRQEWEQAQYDLDASFSRTRGFKPMALLPDRGMGCVDLTIDNRILYFCHKKLTNLQSRGLVLPKLPKRNASSFQPEEAERYRMLWEHYFRFNKIKCTSEWSVDKHIITTDGVGVTVRMRRKLRPGEKQAVSKRDEYLFKYETLKDVDKKTVIGLDPGRRDLFNAVKVELDEDGIHVKTKHRKRHNSSPKSETAQHCSNKEWGKETQQGHTESDQSHESDAVENIQNKTNTTRPNRMLKQSHKSDTVENIKTKQTQQGHIESDAKTIS